MWIDKICTNRHRGVFFRYLQQLITQRVTRECLEKRESDTARFIYQEVIESSI